MKKLTIPYFIPICNSQTKNIRVHWKYKFTFIINAHDKISIKIFFFSILATIKI